LGFLKNLGRVKSSLKRSYIKAYISLVNIALALSLMTIKACQASLSTKQWVGSVYG